MVIKNIKIANFKSFRELDLNLGNFNILIGSNASGKSNFVQIFQFLRKIIEVGFENAISLQGGIEFLRNINLGFTKNFSLSVTFEHESGRILMTGQSNRLPSMEITEIIYELELNFTKRSPGFEIRNENVVLNCKFIELKRSGKKIEEKKQLGEGQIQLNRTNGKVITAINAPAEIQLKESDIWPPLLLESHLDSNTLLLQSSFVTNIFSPMKDIFGNIAIYDFDPKLPKRATPITGKAELEEDGTNLAIVLKNILEQKDSKRKLFNHLKDILPFISNLDIEKFADKSLVFKLKESFFEKQFLPATFASDGTISIFLLIIALYFEKKNLTILEEPERNIHPYLISKLLHIMKDASRNKQIIITTHNPEIIKHADPEDILLIARDADGFSTISRPIDKNEIKTFLENEIGFEELFVQNLLGI